MTHDQTGALIFAAWIPLLILLRCLIPNRRTLFTL
jgi:hypothetical protein